MNDDFLKGHNKRPDPHFVERLYQDINRPKWRSQMVTNNLKTALMGVGALALVTMLTIALVPSARAALLDLFLEFNGVSVYIDPESNQLSTTGNSDAVVFEDGDTVAIEGDDELVVIVSGDGMGVETVDADSAEIWQAYSAESPNPPDGYRLQDTGKQMSDGGFMLTWANDAGDTITLTKVAIAAIVEDLPANDTTLKIREPLAGFAIIPSLDGSKDAMYAWAEGNFSLMVIASDDSLTEADLAALAPQ